MGFLDDLMQSKESSSLVAANVAGRLPGGLTLGIVTNNDDPENLRRVRAITGYKGQSIETDWLFRVCAFTDEDAPLPRVGQTIVVGFIDGNPHDGIYFGVLNNAVMPPLDKDSPRDDHTTTTKTDGNRTLNVTGNISMDSGKTIEITSEDEINLTVGSTTLRVSSNGVSINGKDVTVLGAKDDASDKLITRGY